MNVDTQARPDIQQDHLQPPPEHLSARSPIDVAVLRHPSESTYFALAAVVGGLVWAAALLGTLFIILLWVLPVAVSLWLSQEYFRAAMLGNAVRVGPRQYPALHQVVREQCAQLGLRRPPDVFVLNGQGAVNALAVRFLSGKYVLLFSDLVDLLLQSNRIDELRMVVAHELAHHAAGHVEPWRGVLLMPARFVPFLGAAYSRACELTADRIGATLTRNDQAARLALVALACGSKNLLHSTSLEEFVRQEEDVSPFFGFLYEIYSSHPRMTRRVIELQRFAASTLGMMGR